MSPSKTTGKPAAKRSKGAPEEADEPRRLHAGRTYEQRRAERREALLATGLELIGTKGYRAVTICRVSHVTTRYFYEEFSSRDDLLLALYEHLMGQLLPLTRTVEGTALGSPSEQSRARLSAVVHATIDDPRVARIIYLEVVGVSSDLEQRRRDWHRGFAWLMAEKAQIFEPDTPREELELRGLAAVGMMDEIIVDHLLREHPLEPEFLIDCLHRMFVALGADIIFVERPEGEPPVVTTMPHNPRPPSDR
jgi:AcrR family transcriptional regulator